MATADPEDVHRLVGVVVDGRYAVERVVARGGFGVVYKARHVELASPVALKVLVVPAHLRGAEASLVESFRREAQTLAAVRHPAIVRVHDVGSVALAGGECVWMALEWLDGDTLAEDLRARSGARRSPREAFALLDPVLDAVATAHDRGVAHRDLKPANLMLSPAARGGVEVRVLDFGIAKAMRPDERPGTGNTETQSDLSVFSLDHAAPEQVGRARTGPWTDVHALGLLITEALVGRRPYQGTESFELYAAVMAPERPTPARFGLDVGPWEAVLRRAVALHPGDRFRDASTLRAALAACVDAAQAAWERPASDEPAPANASRPRAPRRAIAAALASAILFALAGRFVFATGDRVAAPSPVAAPRPEVSPRVVAPAPPAVTPAVTPIAAVAPTPTRVTGRTTPPRVAPRARPLRATRALTAGDPDIVME